MQHRKLRIAWSVTWGVVAVLLVVLWVRSYGRHYAIARIDTTGNLLAVAFDAGTLSLNHQQLVELNIPLNTPPYTPGWHYQNVIADYPHKGLGWGTHSASRYVTIPFWIISVLIVLAASGPWLQIHFSLRTLLIATTLVAVGLGLIVLLTSS